MTFDRDREIVRASGNVEIRHEGRQLYANNILYNQKTGIVTATGNVTILETTGEKVFGDRMEVTGDLKDGIVENIGVILQDHARIAGAGARLSGERLTELTKATYSPCNLCEDNPARPPLWQIKAVRVIHNKNKKIVDPTSEQYTLLGRVPPYDQGQKAGLLGFAYKTRVLTLLDRVKKDLNLSP